VRLRATVAAAVLATALLAATAHPADASRYLRIGLYDDAQSLFGTATTFPTMQQLHVQELRITLSWGGRFGIATKRPAHPANPDDPAYDWSIYDHAVQQASAAGIHVLFSILWTPSWENGGRGANAAPAKASDLREFAVAAATRYSGSYVAADGTMLPAVRDWTAWNEPNNPIFLSPQYRKTAKGWKIASGAAYAKICNAVYTGIHSLPYASERVACGVTAPRGNNNPNTSRPSVSPVAFLRAAKAGGLRTFDAWAHHPYYASPNETPTTKPVTRNGAAPTAVTLGNIGDLTRVVTELYGRKRIWITEYGYQTTPPDRIVGVSYAKQALYLKQAFALARANPRIDMMLWFLLRDEPRLDGWQSGLLTAAGKKKPAFAAFAGLTAAS
jgi:hypothetical protein